MAKQYVAEGSNSYHYLTIDRVYQAPTARYLHCFGKRFFRDLKTPSGYRIDRYNMTVRVEGYLIDYVDFEVSQGDCIFVVGHYANSIKENNGNKIVVPVLVADAIMKPDYLKYYKTNELGER